MERSYSKIIGTSVFNDSTRPITTVKDLIIDPETGKILAFVVNINKKLIITPLDVLSWGESIKVHNGEAIINANEVLRVENVLKNQIKVISNKVYTKNDEYLGKVIDFSVDNKSYLLKSLYVAKGILGLLRYQSRIIPYKDIIEIKKDKIIVKDVMKKIKESEEEQSIRLEDAMVG